MSWLLFFQIVILTMWFYFIVYGLIEGYFQKKFDKDLELHDIKSARKSYKDYYIHDKLGG